MRHEKERKNHTYTHHFLDVIHEDALQMLVVVEVVALRQGRFVLLQRRVGKQAGRRPYASKLTRNRILRSKHSCYDGRHTELQRHHPPLNNYDQKETEQFALIFQLHPTH